MLKKIVSLDDTKLTQQIVSERNPSTNKSEINPDLFRSIFGERQPVYKGVETTTEPAISLLPQSLFVLVLNCGSSSVKYALYDWEKDKRLTQGNVERIGQANGPANHKVVISDLLGKLKTDGIIQNIQDIKVVGHRVVHGGQRFNQSVIVTPDTLEGIREVSDLAPLHNPANIMGIESSRDILSNSVQTAVFDTAFHHTIPQYAYMYGIPYDWYENYNARQYGFHGTSILYNSRRAAVLLGIPRNQVNLIVLHIGNGASATAVRNGLSVDTTLGLSTVDGLIMGTRPGRIDPGIILYMMKKANYTVSEMSTILHKKSGHLGITGQYTDRRDIVAEAKKGNSRCALSLAIEAYRLKKIMGEFYAVLGQVDAVVFTAGVGENSPEIRQMSTEGLENLGIIMNQEQNAKIRSKDGESVLSEDHSPVKILMIPTNEEAVIAEDSVALLEGRYHGHENYVYRFEK